MISFINGKIEGVLDDSVIIENNGIGYKVFTSRYSIDEINAKMDRVKMYTKMIVKEDDIQLCGFATPKELKVFEMLTSVSGVGTKVGVAILSSIYYDNLVQSIIQEDLQVLVKAPGVGKKTAQRIILELKDKMKKQFGQVIVTRLDDLPLMDNSIVASEVCDALVGLGYSAKEAKQVVGKLEHFTSLEEGIKKALKHLV